jgi:hypothetical protein
VDGTIFTWGCGQRGRLGNGTENDVLVPTPVAALKSIRFIQVKCGDWHCAAISNLGELWTVLERKKKTNSLFDFVFFAEIAFLVSMIPSGETARMEEDWVVVTK